MVVSWHIPLCLLALRHGAQTLVPQAWLALPFVSVAPPLDVDVFLVVQLVVPVLIYPHCAVHGCHNRATIVKGVKPTPNTAS